MKSVEDKWDEAAWGELAAEQYATLLLALANSQPSGFLAFLTVLRDALGGMVDSLVQQVGEEGAVKLLAEVLQTGNTLKFENVEVGRQFWINQECLPSCANPALFCIPLPPSTALYVAWNYEEQPRM